MRQRRFDDPFPKGLAQLVIDFHEAKDPYARYLEVACDGRRLKL